MLFLLCGVLFFELCWFESHFPDEFYATEGTGLTLSGSIQPMKATEAVSPAGASQNGSYRTGVGLYGIFPLKEVTVHLTETPFVALCGTPMGIILNQAGGPDSGTAPGVSANGLGMLTFYDPATRVFGGLGHQARAGAFSPEAEGTVTTAQITGLARAGTAEGGQLYGVLGSRSIGELKRNGETGIYGTLNGYPSATAVVPVLMKQQVHTGEAALLTTVDGSQPALYSIRIEAVTVDPNRTEKNLSIVVTDPELLHLTGGILQGMSGSPILQDGAWAGTLTHVRSNDPARGYAIFAEQMYEDAGIFTK